MDGDLPTSRSPTPYSNSRARTVFVIAAIVSIAGMVFGAVEHHVGRRWESGRARWGPTVFAQGADPVALRIIIVSSSDRAAQIAERLKQGADFAALARSESLDPSSARGGLIGPIQLSELRDELRRALTPLAPGEVSGIVPVPTGFALLRREAAAARGARIRGTEVLAVSAEAAVKATLSVDGFAEAATALENFPKPDGWNQSPPLVCELRQQAVDSVRVSLSRLLSRGTRPPLATPDLEVGPTADFTPIEVLEGHISFGQIGAYTGDIDLSIAQFEQAHRLAQMHDPAALADLEQMIGIAHVHKAGMDNGIYRSPGDRCLLAPRAGAPLPTPEAFDRGVRRIVSLLDTRPEDVELKWFLNAAFMATGGYPERVPARHLIPPGMFVSSEDVGHFVDVSSEAGVESYSSAGGVVVEDFDNDGTFDILTSNFDSCGRMQLFRRRADGRFEDRAAAAGLADQLGGLNLAQADYDNDGCMDVLVMRGGWELAQRRSLLRNNCDGTFTDVTAAAGLMSPVTSSQTAVWTDIDNDGSIDLFVGNEDAPLQLFRNRGDGTFEDIAAAAGVQRTGFTKAVTAGDYDNDGFPDLYVSNFRGGNVLFRNNGNRTFSDVTAAAGVVGPDRGFPAWFFDYDNDGWDDLFVTSYYLSVEETGRSYLKLPLNAATMMLYRNAGDGTFVDVTTAAGLEMALMPMGANFGDIDNDGFLDIYLGTGSPSYVSLAPSVLLRNRAGRSFVDVTMASGTGEMHKGHGVAFADLDGDGDQEIAFKVGGATPGDAHAFRLFENPGHGNDWLAVRASGVKSNRGAIGARIRVTVEDMDGSRREIRRTVNSGGSFGASPLEQHFGLGRAVRIVEVQVTWPATGMRQRFTDVGKNQVIEIRETADRYTTLNRPRLALGRRNP